MKLAGRATLSLVDGAVPHFPEMVVLGREIFRALVDVLGADAAVERFSDPFWVSSLACVLGFEHNTSGQTTVTLKALKHSLAGTDLPVRILGGKGLEMRRAQLEAAKVLGEIGVEEAGEIRRVMKLTASVDDAALQDLHDVYFQATIVSETGKWTVIDQGMNIETLTARRYHWTSEIGASVEEPHAEILSDQSTPIVLDLTSPASSETRETVLEMLSDSPPSRLNEDLAQAKALLKKQAVLDREYSPPLTEIPERLLPPQRFDEDTIRRAKYVRKFEELLLTPGCGAATIRGLAYIAVLLYGSRASWKDPVKFTYAFGTKSGKPYHVNKQAMRQAADILREVVFVSRLAEADKITVLRRLKSFVESLEREDSVNH
ncbi:MAG: DUF763 domain-containing protein [Candidatus Caldarchaeum sp.]|nr:DUF763 domain-containing protein [Candidatus Caldarchaeum sp.]